MRRTPISADEKRLTLRMSQGLWRQLRLEAARRDVSATLLINQLIEERLGELGRDGPASTLDRVTAQGAPWFAPHVTSSAEGEVVFEWWNDPRKLTVYCTAEDANFVKVWGP